MRANVRTSAERGQERKRQKDRRGAQRYERVRISGTSTDDEDEESGAAEMGLLICGGEVSSGQPQVPSGALQWTGSHCLVPAAQELRVHCLLALTHSAWLHRDPESWQTSDGPPQPFVGINGRGGMPTESHRGEAKTKGRLQPQRQGTKPTGNPIEPNYHGRRSANDVTNARAAMVQAVGGAAGAERGTVRGGSADCRRRCTAARCPRTSARGARWWPSRRRLRRVRKRRPGGMSGRRTA